MRVWWCNCASFVSKPDNPFLLRGRHLCFMRRSSRTGRTLGHKQWVHVRHRWISYRSVNETNFQWRLQVALIEKSRILVHSSAQNILHSKLCSHTSIKSRIPFSSVTLGSLPLRIFKASRRFTMASSAVDRIASVFTSQRLVSVITKYQHFDIPVIGLVCPIRWTR